MFYLIIAVLIMSYYFFMAPKSIRNTINLIGVVVLVALLLVLTVMSFVKLIQSPPEIFVVFGMTVLGFFAIRDVLRMSDKSGKTKKQIK